MQIDPGTFSDISAMSYESIMRSAYQSGRTLKNGADADIYRKFLRNARAYHLQLDSKNKKEFGISSKSIDELLYDFQVAGLKVKRHLIEAIDQLKKESNIDPENLVEITNLLSDVTVVKNVNEAVSRLSIVFQSISRSSQNIK